MNGETKKVTYYVDLWQGWTESQFPPCLFCNVGTEKMANARRFRVTVEFPTLDAVDGEAVAAVEEVKGP